MLKLTFFVAVLAAFGFAWLAGGTLGSRKTDRKPDINLLTQGHVEDTMARARTLLTALRENEWDAERIDYHLLRVPDQDFAQFERLRGPNTYASFFCARQDIYRAKVAFYIDLYIRKNLEVVPGIEGVLHVEGFYIVGWKDGRIERVPWDQVRLYPSGPGFKDVFPGMDEYDPELPRINDPDAVGKVDAVMAAKKKAK